MTAAEISSTENAEVLALLYALGLNLILFFVIIAIFEPRHRGLAAVPAFPLGWLFVLIRSPTEVCLLDLLGMDAYVLLRYILFCIKLCTFLTCFGLVVLVPLYGSAAKNSDDGWNRYTLANVPDGSINGNSNELWAPAVLMYTFSLYFCYLLNDEFGHFVKIRVAFLIGNTLRCGHNCTGDCAQRYTIMLENIPPSIRTQSKLQVFFQKLFPGDSVPVVQVALLLPKLERLVRIRKKVRDKLEKFIALKHATGRCPLFWTNYFHFSNWIRICAKGYPIDNVDIQYLYQYAGSYPYGCHAIDSISCYQNLLSAFNILVSDEQAMFVESTQTPDALNPSGPSNQPPIPLVNISELNANTEVSFVSICSCLPQRKRNSSGVANDITQISVLLTRYISSLMINLRVVCTRFCHVDSARWQRRVSIYVSATDHISSTGFVTFSSLSARTIACRILLSHGFHALSITTAPHPEDIIWENIAISKAALDSRHTAADCLFTCGALFWSVVVAGINGWAELDNIAEREQWLARYINNRWYRYVNEYLAAVVLLVLLSLLPFIFDVSARYFEKIKTEGEIQSSLCTRYFYYQLANIFVTVFSGTIWQNVAIVAKSPSTVIDILAVNLPDRSIFFAILVITRTLIGLPIELLRLGPLLTLVRMKICCFDKEKITQRELSEKTFNEPIFLFGWYYPQLLMVLIIAVTYASIAPLLMPICLLFFIFSYVVYKYQLLYIYTGRQSLRKGGDGSLWYVVFNRSMLALMCGTLTTVGYLGIRKTYISGPFYVVIPLPFLLVWFWRMCNGKYVLLSKEISLENAIELDARVSECNDDASPTVCSSGLSAFRQPVLKELPLHPESSFLLTI